MSSEGAAEVMLGGLGDPPVTAPVSPDLAAGLRLLDNAKHRGFRFRRVAPGPDGPLQGVRESAGWRDVIHLGGFSSGCYAWRERRTSLVLPGSARAQIRVEGGALDVLTEVLGWPELLS